MFFFSAATCLLVVTTARDMGGAPAVSGTACMHLPVGTLAGEVRVRGVGSFFRALDGTTIENSGSTRALLVVWKLS